MIKTDKTATAGEGKWVLFEGKTYKSITPADSSKVATIIEVNEPIVELPYTEEQLKVETEKLMAEIYTAREEAIIQVIGEGDKYDKYLADKIACENQAKINLTPKEENE